jgi:hypothetical protein
VTIFLDIDSIYHPQLAFSYLINQDKISLYRDNKMGISSAPFVDYFHNLEFYVDEIKWDLNSPKIEIDNLAGDAPVKFESINYFRDSLDNIYHNDPNCIFLPNYNKGQDAIYKVVVSAIGVMGFIGYTKAAV